MTRAEVDRLYADLQEWLRGRLPAGSTVEVRVVLPPSVADIALSVRLAPEEPPTPDRGSK